MNEDALNFFVQLLPRLRAVVMLTETGKKYIPKETPEPVDVPKNDIRAAVKRFLDDYEKRGKEAAVALETALEKDAAGLPAGFFNPSREDNPVLKFVAHITWMEKHFIMPDWDVRKALLLDLPETWGDICRDLRRHV